MGYTSRNEVLNRHRNIQPVDNWEHVERNNRVTPNSSTNTNLKLLHKFSFYTVATCFQALIFTSTWSPHHNTHTGSGPRFQSTWTQEHLKGGKSDAATVLDPWQLSPARAGWRWTTSTRLGGPSVLLTCWRQRSWHPLLVWTTVAWTCVQQYVLGTELSK